MDNESLLRLCVGVCSSTGRSRKVTGSGRLRNRASAEGCRKNRGPGNAMPVAHACRPDANAANMHSGANAERKTSHLRPL